MHVNRDLLVTLVFVTTLATCVVASGGDNASKPQPVEGSTEWWNMKKEEASRRTGAKVWAWELETPPWHCLWYNTSKYDRYWEDEIDLDHDPPEDPDIMNMEVIPRPCMPDWWCPTPCGTLNLSSKRRCSSWRTTDPACTGPYTQHCFPPDGSSHSVCCVGIQLPATLNAEVIKDPAFMSLEDRIRAASHPSSYSWCACNQFVCEELLGGRVAWDQVRAARANRTSLILPRSTPSPTTATCATRTSLDSTTTASSEPASPV
eukprot:345844-Hanusia_phi.AAC.2